MRVTHDAQVMPTIGSESSVSGSATGLVIGPSGYYRGVYGRALVVAVATAGGATLARA
jgi:hypothetical protein